MAQRDSTRGSDAGASTLGALKVGDSATITRVSCSRSTRVRLLEMGLVKGTRIEIRRVAPLGCPLELFVSGYHLSIRRSEAHEIEVVDVATEQKVSAATESVLAGSPGET